MDASKYRILIPLFDELSDRRIIVRPYQENDAQALFAAANKSREQLRPWLSLAD